MKEKLAEFLLTIQGFRKFLFCILVLIIGTVFRAKALVSGNEWEDLAKSVAISFCATNGLEGITTCIKEHLAIRRASGNLLASPQDTKDDGDEAVELVPTGDSK
jgi:hypothetical protein